MMNVSTNTGFSELSTLGMKFYEEKLKTILEPKHIGEFVAIEPYSGRYFVDEDSTKVALKALAELPGQKFFFVRVGFKYAHKIGGSWLKKKA